MISDTCVIISRVEVRLLSFLSHLPFLHSLLDTTLHRSLMSGRVRLSSVRVEVCSTLLPLPSVSCSSSLVHRSPSLSRLSSSPFIPYFEDLQADIHREIGLTRKWLSMLKTRSCLRIMRYSFSPQEDSVLDLRNDDSSEGLPIMLTLVRFPETLLTIRTGVISLLAVNQTMFSGP
jgi:hypothetical protein